MVNTVHNIALLSIIALLSGCGTVFESTWTHVDPQDKAEIKVALREVTNSPIVSWCEPYSRTELCFVTKDGTMYRAEKIGHKWRFTKPVIVAIPAHLTRRWS
jgi:uncharacterized protein YceK